ncbi:MAG: chemotaxis protein CheW [Candidatus Krumholzibacteriales bacterium]
METETRTAAEQEIQFITFTLGNEKYAVEIEKVKEVILPIDTYPVPGMPVQVRGVINLRGEIVPILEIVSSLGISDNSAGSDEKSRRIIIIDGEDGGIGFEVDRVIEVVRIPKSAIKSDLGNVNINREVLDGIVQEQNGIILCINPEKIISSFVDVAQLRKADAPL